MRSDYLTAALGPGGCLATALAEGEEVALRVAGNCMEPNVSDQALVRLGRPRFFVPGDVVVFQYPDQSRLLVHRFLGYVRRRGTWKLMTMADRAARPDPLIDMSRVLGRVIERSGRTCRVAPRARLEAIRRYAVWCARCFARRLTS
jgi:hypothetical protein